MAVDVSCDVVVIGAGPAGLTAGIYLARAGLEPVILEKLGPGGQMAITDIVENYPGFEQPVGGLDLADTMRRQAENFGAVIRTSEVTEITGGGIGREKVLRLSEGELRCRAVVIATGARSRRLGVPGEERLWGKGISCCATCDGMFYRDKRIVVVGGGDAAVKETLFLTKFAEHITIVHRRSQLRAAKALQDKLLGAGSQVSFVYSSAVEEIVGRDHVEAVRIVDVNTGQEHTLDCDGVFIFVGFTPNTGFLRGVVDLDERGYVVTDETMATSVPGIYAAGDCRRRPLRQIVTACGDGAVAAQSVYELLEAALPEITDTDIDRISRPGVSLLCVCSETSSYWQEQASLLERMAETFADNVAFYRLDPAAGPAIIERYAVRSRPVLLILRDGKEMRRLEGVVDESEIAEALEEVLASQGSTQSD